MIRQLLSHDYHNRPSAKKLLISGLLPPAETAQLEEKLQMIVSNQQSKLFKQCVSGLFSLAVSTSWDLNYDQVEEVRLTLVVYCTTSRSLCLS